MDTFHGESFTLLQHSVHHKDQTIGAGEVVAPHLDDPALAADIPHGKLKTVRHLDGLHVEPDRGDGGHGLAELEPIEQGGLPRSVEAQNKNLAVLQRGVQEGTERGKELAHGG